VTSLEIVQAMKVINDHAEYGVALVQELHLVNVGPMRGSTTFLFQVVDQHRRAFPDSQKQTLAGHSGQGP